MFAREDFAKLRDQLAKVKGKWLMSINETKDWLQVLPSNLLVAISSGQIDAKKLASILLAERGQNDLGLWVGFAEAKKVHGLTA